MRKIYNIDFTKLVVWLIPPRLRVQFWIDWGKALVSPISSLYNKWKTYYNDVAYRLDITGQVCKLESALNDAFDNIERRITITDTLEKEVLLIHTDEAQKPLIIQTDSYVQTNGGAVIIYTNSAYANSGYDFNINIPFTLTKQDEIRLKSILGTYKLPSKRYKILYL